MTQHDGIERKSLTFLRNIYRENLRLRTQDWCNADIGAPVGTHYAAAADEFETPPPLINFNRRTECLNACLDDITKEFKTNFRNISRSVTVAKYQIDFEMHLRKQSVN